MATTRRNSGCRKESCTAQPGKPCEGCYVMYPTVVGETTEICLAKALHDNIAASPDELSFSRGDILRVIDQDVADRGGWWLCELRGDRGLVRGGSLHLLGSDIQTEQKTPPPFVEKKWNRRSWKIRPDKVMTPKKLGDIFLYVHPEQSLEDYDIPASRYFPVDGAASAGPMKSKSLNDVGCTINISINVPTDEDPRSSSVSNLSLIEDIYDVPPSRVSTSYASSRPHSAFSNIHPLPSREHGADSTSGSTRPSLEVDTENIYDIPRPSGDVVYTPVTIGDGVDGNEIKLPNSNKGICTKPLAGHAGCASQFADSEVTTSQPPRPNVGEEKRDGERVITHAGIGLSCGDYECIEAVRGENYAQQRSRKPHSMLHGNDKKLLVDYGAQIKQHNTNLVKSADTFFHCVEYSHPLKALVNQSKMVILGARNMVRLGDKLYQNILVEEVSSKIMVCANYLCITLIWAAIATKNAVLQHPNVVAMQEMVDRVSDVMTAANELKLVVTQAALL